MSFELIAQFLFGIGGALVIIYLRLYDALPRMPGQTLIKDRSLEADELSEKWHSLAQKSEKIDPDILKDLRDDYQLRETEIRKEIRSLKFRQWTLAATLYIILGGLFSLIVFPLISEGKILMDGSIQSVEALKCMGIGFTWTAYISLLESKTPEKEAKQIREKALDEAQKRQTIEEQKAKLAEQKNAELSKKAAQQKKQYEEQISSLKDDFKLYKEKANQLIEKYKELLS